MQSYVALDIGGTSIKAGILSLEGKLLSPTLCHYPSKSNEDLDTFLEHLVHIITSEIQKLPFSLSIQGIGMAFPGPFDYKKGISLMQNIDKYDALYGIPLKQPLLTKLYNHPLFKSVAIPNCPVAFENDASLYGLGEVVQNPQLASGKVLCLCIGTGLGSAFIEDSKLITSRLDVPTNGWVYDTPFLDSIIDDYISARGILTLHHELHGIASVEVKSLAQAALEGDEKSVLTFTTFGTRLGKAILSFLDTYQPHTLILGGQIAKSYPLFAPSFKQELETLNHVPTICLSHDSSYSTVLGVCKLFPQNNPA